MAGKTQTPQGWREVRLGDMADVLDARRIPLNAEDRSKMPGEYPYYGANGVIDFIDRWIFDEDDDLVLLAEDGGHFDEFRNRPIAFRVEGKCWVNNHAHVLKATTCTVGGFLFHSLVNKDIRLYINGTTRSKLTQADLLQVEVSLPPLPVQRAIAAALDSIDDAIERTDAVIAATEQLRGSLLHELLTRGLPGWHTAWKEVPGLGTMPADWDMVRLGDVAEIVMGQSPPGGKCNRVEDGVPLLNGPTEFGPYYPTPVQWTTDPKKGAGVGDILFCVRGATAGRMNWSDRDYAIGRGIASLKHKGGPAYQSFLRAVIDFRLAELLTVVTGSTFPNLSYDQITQLRVPRVPSSEQQAIADTLDGIDGVLVQRRLERDALRSLKDSTADALLTGLVKAIR